MFGWTFVHQPRVHLVWAAVAIVAGLAFLELRGRGSLGALLSPLMQRRLVLRPSLSRTIARLALVLVALLAGILALMRPQARGETVSVAGSRVAADVIVVLDVSKSMLAEDASPNRLTRAKVELAAMARQLRGHRLGIVAFAGRAVLLCPLTPDHAFFDLVLGGIDTRSVSRGGTRIGDAVRTAVAAFPSGPGAKLIVLITDGEDHESAPIDAAKAAAEAGVRIVAVGLGSEEGSPIVITDPKTGAKTPMLHDGSPVVSRLDGKTLREMAATTEGVYVPAGTSALDLESIVREHIQPIVREEADAAQRVIPAERYPWMVLLALCALVAAVAVGSRAGRAA
jgi:Ca-activated chloride channel family protein